MVALSLEKRRRLVAIYYENQLHGAKKRFERLIEIAAMEQIEISSHGARNILKKWIKTGSVANRPSESRGIRHRKITERQLAQIDKAVKENRGLTAAQLKERFNLQASVRTIQTYKSGSLNWKILDDKQALEACGRLDEALSHVDSILRDPCSCIDDKLNELRTKVRADHNEKRRQLEENTKKLLAKLDQYESVCKQTLKDLNETGLKELGRVREANRKELDEWLAAINDIKYDANELKTVEEQCSQKLAEMNDKMKVIKSKLLMMEPEDSTIEVDEIEPFVDSLVLDLSSKIIDKKCIKKFYDLCEFDADTKFELLYRGSRDGFKASDFHSRCDNKPKTVTIVKTNDNSVFGGYTEAIWNGKTTGLAKDPNAFVFVLRDFSNEPIKVKIAKGFEANAISNHSKSGPSFGEDNLYISNDCDKQEHSRFHLMYGSYQHVQYQNKDTNDQDLDEEIRFKVAEIEVFQLA